MKITKINLTYTIENDLKNIEKRIVMPLMKEIEHVENIDTLLTQYINYKDL